MARSAEVMSGLFPPLFEIDTLECGQHAQIVERAALIWPSGNIPSLDVPINLSMVSEVET